jgi:hypothetical protein
LSRFLQPVSERLDPPLESAPMLSWPGPFFVACEIFQRFAVRPIAISFFGLFDGIYESIGSLWRPLTRAASFVAKHHSMIAVP